MSGSISPIDACSAASVGTSMTVMENLRCLKTVCNWKNAPAAAAPKISGRGEEPLQPEVTYSDIQLTPRNNNDFEDEVCRAREIPCRTSKREDAGTPSTGTVGGDKRPPECGGEGEEGEGQGPGKNGGTALI